MSIRAPAIHWAYLFERALTEEIGIAFIAGNVKREAFRNVLYECRKQAQDPRYADLIIFAPAAPCADEIWICKKAVEMDA